MFGYLPGFFMHAGFLKIFEQMFAFLFYIDYNVIRHG